jgi:arginase family enzyme
MELLNESRKITFLDIVEVNPMLDNTSSAVLSLRWTSPQASREA